MQDSADSSHGKVHKLPPGSAGEGSSEPSSKLKQSAQQTTKPESEDSSSSLSSFSSDSESSDEEVPSKGKMKELPPPPPLKKRQISKHKNDDEVNLNPQEEMIDANIDQDQGAVHTPGLRDPHHI